MSISIRTFDSDLDDFQAMMDAAWAKDYTREPRLDFNTAFLRWHFESPGVDPDLIVAAYDEQTVVGLGTSFPRSMMLKGKPLVSALSTFFTVHADYRRQRIGWRLVEERLRRLRERGVQCNFVYLMDGHASQPLYERLGRETDIRVENIHRSAFRIRLLDAASVSERALAAWGDAMVTLPVVPDGPCIRPLQAADLPRCRELLNQVQETVPLARVWNSDTELGWQIDHAPFAQTLVAVVNGQIEGLLNWYVTNRIGRTTVPTAMIDQFSFVGLDAPESEALLATALHRMAASGCTTANLNAPTFCDEVVMENLGFVTFEIYLNLYAVVLDTELDLSGLDRIYLDTR